MVEKTSSKVRLSDIAELTSVSVATVSMALQNHPAIKHATRVAIHQVARELGYKKPGVVLASIPGATPGVSLSGGSARPSRPAHLGFIAVDKAAAMIHEENFSPLVHVLMRHTTRMGVRMQMASIPVDTPLPEAEAQAGRFADGLDGILVCGELRQPFLAMLQKLGVPVVVLGACALEAEDPEMWALNRVAFDTVGMARTAVRHHLARGKRRIALMNGTLSGQKGFWTDLWMRGYCMALCEAGIMPDERLAISYRPGEGNEGWVKRLTENPARPDAVVWADTGMAQSAWPLFKADAMGLRLMREDHVVSGQKHMFAARGFDGYPMVMEDNAAMARTGILALRALIAGTWGDAEQHGGMTIHIPFEFANLSLSTISKS